MNDRPSPTSPQQRTLDRLKARMDYVSPGDAAIVASRKPGGRSEQRFVILADGSLESGRRHLDAAERRDVR